MKTVGVILAGGRSRRMGGDKALRQVAGVRLLDRCLARLAPQVDQVVLSANSDPDRLAGYALPIVTDATGAGRGPLAGILAGLCWSRNAYGPDCVVVSLPCDTPFVPLDLAQRLTTARSAMQADIAVATSLGRVHNAVAAWPVTLIGPLETFLATAGSSAIHAFLAPRQVAPVDFAGHPDPFFNVNTPDDLHAAAAFASSGAG